MKKDKRPTKIYPDRRDVPAVLPLEEKPNTDVVILPEPPAPPII